MFAVANILDSAGPKPVPLPDVGEIPFVPDEPLNIGHGCYKV
jgi:hypothetical protein